MTGSRAFDMLKHAHVWLSGSRIVSRIVFDVNKDLGFGLTRIIRNGVSVQIGTSALENNPDREFRDGEVMQPFVALFHEVAGHAMQLTDEFRRDRTMSKVLFLSHCACAGSAQYYGVADGDIPMPMYFSHPHEIAAQYMGIKCANQYLSHLVGPDKAETMMMDYVAYRRERGCEFLPADAKCNTVKDVLREMNNEFRRRIEAHRDFDPVFDENDALGMFDKRRLNVDTLPIVRDCRNGLRQDNMMACVFFETMQVRMSDSVSFLRSTPVFKHVSMEPGPVFCRAGCPIFPPVMTPMLNLKQLAGVTDKLDRPSNRTRDGPDM